MRNKVFSVTACHSNHDKVSTFNRHGDTFWAVRLRWAAGKPKGLVRSTHIQDMPGTIPARPGPGTGTSDFASGSSGGSLILRPGESNWL